jgi:hypothetical protein
MAWNREVDRDPRGQTAFGLSVSGDLVRFEVVRNQEDGVDVEDSDGDGGAATRKGRGKGKVLTRHEDLLLQMSADGRGKRLVRSEAGWEEWCEGMDGFGSIVLLVASMVA